MATIPYLVISPTAILSTLTLLINKKRSPIPEPSSKAPYQVDVLVPAYECEQTICATLASLSDQTLKPNKIILVDDHSTDNTVIYAENFAKKINLPIEIIRRDKRQGKTPSVKYLANNSSAEAIFILDADTVLCTDDFIEKTTSALFHCQLNASACGQVLPFNQQANNEMKQKYAKLAIFYQNNKNASLYDSISFTKRIAHSITNGYRYCLYIFLQRFVYRAQMSFAETVVNPVGCAVAYRRDYLQQLFNDYEDSLGVNLSTSEDIFIGFSFCNDGYKNLLLEDILAATQEPSIFSLHKQVILWSSSFFQCCYYFKDLVKTPFKCWRKKPDIEIHRNLETEQPSSEHKISAQEYSKKYGRKIGWFIFTGLVEKIAFPLVILLLVFLQLWKPLLLTVIAESLITSYIFCLFAPKKQLIKRTLQCFLITPIRYSHLVYDLFVFGKFIFDIIFKRELNWRK